MKGVRQDIAERVAKMFFKADAELGDKLAQGLGFPAISSKLWFDSKLHPYNYQTKKMKFVIWVDDSFDDYGCLDYNKKIWRQNLLKHPNQTKDLMELWLEKVSSPLLGLALDSTIEAIILWILPNIASSKKLFIFFSSEPYPLKTNLLNYRLVSLSLGNFQ